MDIPYTVEAHPETGLHNSKLAIWLFLASEVMLFGGLFSAYVLLRVNHPDWPHGSTWLDWRYAALNTVLLVSSSITIVAAWNHFRLNQAKLGRRYIIITILFALAFLVVKSVEYSFKIQHGYLPSTNTFLALYFTLTGLHGLHVIGGLAVLVFLALPGFKLWDTCPEQFTNRIEVVGIYWHFVDLIWLLLFALLYLF